MIVLITPFLNPVLSYCTTRWMGGHWQQEIPFPTSLASRWLQAGQRWNPGRGLRQHILLRWVRSRVSSLPLPKLPAQHRAARAPGKPHNGNSRAARCTEPGFLEHLWKQTTHQSAGPCVDLPWMGNKSLSCSSRCILWVCLVESSIILSKHHYFKPKCTAIFNGLSLISNPKKTNILEEKMSSVNSNEKRFLI